MKELDSNIHSLKIKCGYANEDEIVFDNIKAVSQIEDESKQVIDSFIANIKSDMCQIAEIKYLGYKQDLQTLYQLAEDYLEEKRKLGTISDTYVLSQNPKYFQVLVEIEDRMKEGLKVRQDQEANMKVLSQMKSILYQEKVSLQQIQLSETIEKKESDIEASRITLTLQAD